VLISASVGAGHDGVAAELARRLGAMGVEVDRHDFLDLMPRRSGTALRAIYRWQLELAPRSWGWLLAAGQRKGVGGRMTAMTAMADAATLHAIGAGAAAVVSTYPLASQVLGRLGRTGQLKVPTLTYLTDMSVHPIWVADGVDIHLAIHDEAAAQAKALGATDVRVIEPAVPAGFAVGARAADLVAARDRWGLPRERPLALVVAGAWGVGDIERTSREIAATGLAVPVVVCGRNDALRQRLRRTGVAIALDWVDDMAALVRTCQVMVQNAGGLSSLEGIVAGIPVVTYRCIPGHGRSNAEALDRAGLVPWIRTPADLRAGLRQALAPDTRASGLAALRPEQVVADLIAARRARGTERALKPVAAP